MIKLTAAISKRDDWTREEWLIHYKERHASLSASVPKFTRHGSRYLQNYALRKPAIPDFPEVSDHMAVTELWFPSVEALRTAYAEPDYMKYLRTDELRFCSFDNLLAGVAQEFPVFDGTSSHGDKTYVNLPRAKIFLFRTENSNIDRGEFQRLWKAERAPRLMSTSHFERYAKRYLQSHILDVDVGIPGGVSHGLIDEIWFDSIDDAVAYYSAYRTSAMDSADDAKHLENNSTWAIFATEHEVFGPLPD